MDQPPSAHVSRRHRDKPVVPSPGCGIASRPPPGGPYARPAAETSPSPPAAGSNDPPLPWSRAPQDVYRFPSRQPDGHGISAQPAVDEMRFARPLVLTPAALPKPESVSLLAESPSVLNSQDDKATYGRPAQQPAARDGHLGVGSLGLVRCSKAVSVHEPCPAPYGNGHRQANRVLDLPVRPLGAQLWFCG